MNGTAMNEGRVDDGKHGGGMRQGWRPGESIAKLIELMCKDCMSVGLRGLA